MMFIGNEWNQIDFSGYQVSNQCASLVEANLLCPTSHPELAYLREVPLTPSQYITDVYYMVCYIEFYFICLLILSFFLRIYKKSFTGKE